MTTKSKPKIDKATVKNLEEGDLLQELVEHGGWKIAKKRFTELVVQVGDIFSITDAAPEDVFRQLAARQIAIELLMTWFKEIEGRAKQHKANSDVYAAMRSETYILRNDEE